MCNVTLMHIHKTTVAMEINKYYIFLCVCVCVRARACVCVGAQARACACVRVGFLIQYATHRCHIVCVLSGSTIFFYIIS
jgi:hypothetical protein